MSSISIVCMKNTIYFGVASKSTKNDCKNYARQTPTCCIKTSSFVARVNAVVLAQLSTQLLLQRHHSNQLPRYVSVWLSESSFDFNCAQSKFVILLNGNNSNKSSMRSQSPRYKCKPLQSSASLALPNRKRKLLVVRRWQSPQIRPKANSWRWQVHSTQQRMLAKYSAHRRLHLLPVRTLCPIGKIPTQLTRLTNICLFLLQHLRWESRWTHRNR